MRRLNYYLIHFEDEIQASKTSTVICNNKPWLKVEVIYNADYDYIYTAYAKYSFKEVKCTPLMYRMIRERHVRIGWEMKHLAYKDAK